MPIILYGFLKCVLPENYFK